MRAAVFPHRPARFYHTPIAKGEQTPREASYHAEDARSPAVTEVGVPWVGGLRWKLQGEAGASLVPPGGHTDQVLSPLES